MGDPTGGQGPKPVYTRGLEIQLNIHFKTRPKACEASWITVPTISQILEIHIILL